MGKLLLVERYDGCSGVLEVGIIKLADIDYNKIINEVSALIDDDKYYEKMSKAMNSYGDRHEYAGVLKSFVYNIG